MASLTANSVSRNSCLILHAGALGDCVLTLHVAMAMRRTGHKITMAARSPIAAWAARRRMIDESIPLDRLGPLLWETNPPPATADLRPDGRDSESFSHFENFDRIISFLGGPEESVARRLTELFGPDRVIHIDPRPTEKTIREGTHITRQWVEEINRQGLDSKFEISDLKFSIEAVNNLSDDATSPHHHLATLPNVLVHPGSGGLAKCCPLEAMEALVRELLARGWHAQWMIGPDEVERDGSEFLRRLERNTSVTFEESLDSAADLVVTADAFIGNDAGMTHVAALVGVNTVALFGPTDPRVWRPHGSHCDVFRFPSSDEPELNWVESLMRIVSHKQ